MAGIPLAEGNTEEITEIEFHRKIEPLLQDYCYDCHGDGANKGDFVLDAFKSTAELLQNQHVWLRIWENLRTQSCRLQKRNFSHLLENGKK